MGHPVLNVVIDLGESVRFRVATVEALSHAAARLGVEPTIQVVATERIDDALFSDLGDGVVVGPGTPYRVPEAAEEMIRRARERGVPLVGT